MKSYEEQYFEGLNKIMTEGVVCVSGRQTEGSRVTKTKRTWGISFTVDLEKEFPVLKSKHVAIKSAIREILWIMVKQSSNINDLIPHIWDKWADKTGSVGKSYGYQVGVTTRHSSGIYDNQLQYVRDLLHKDPSSRHGVIDIWNPEELREMNLVPCCYTSHFAILGSRLNCMLTQRSGDYLVGVPFNTTQYAFLTMALARDLGVKPGILLHNISDAHVYESQYGNFDTDEKTKSYETLINNYAAIKRQRDFGILDRQEKQVKIIFKNPNTDIFTIGDYDFDVENYKIGEDCYPDIEFKVEQ